jgi:hypothetical protein
MGGSEGKAPRTLYLDAGWSGQLHVPATLPPTPHPRKGGPLSTEHAAGWVTEPVYKFRRKQKSLTPTRNRTMTPRLPSPQILDVNT